MQFYPHPFEFARAAHPTAAVGPATGTQDQANQTFLFNMALGGVGEAAIPEPANTVLFYESKAWPDGIRIVAFSDGHVKKEDKDQWEVSKKYLTQKYTRTGKRPLLHQSPDSLFRNSDPGRL